MVCINCGKCCKAKNCSELVTVERMGTNRVYGICVRLLEGKGESAECFRKSANGKGGYCVKGMEALDIKVENVAFRQEEYSLIIKSLKECSRKSTREIKASREDIKKEVQERNSKNNYERREFYGKSY